MGYLERFRRKAPEGRRSATLKARLPEDLYQKFQQYVNDLGLTMSEAVYLLIERELHGPQVGTTREPTATMSEGAMTTPRPRRTTPRATGGPGGRFTVAPWDVGGYVPCPICETWISRSNIARHARQFHDKTTQELIEENKDKADEMAQRAREQAQA